MKNKRNDGRGMKRGLIEGLGINDSDYLTHYQIDGNEVICPFYKTWISMFKRAYNKKYHLKNPTYVDVSVAIEWHSFMAFRAWMISQDWEGKQLDKDLLFTGNRVYSPEKCFFVHSKLNKLLCDNAKQRGDMPLGVSISMGVCFACIRKNGKKYNLGRDKNKMIAHALWQKAKAEIIELAANEQTDERLKNSLMQRVYKLRDDLLNGRETIKL